jgi:hypothetical protein
MAHGTRVHRRGVYRQSPARGGWNRVTRAQVRRALAALAALYRR